LGKAQFSSPQKRIYFYFVFLERSHLLFPPSFSSPSPFLLFPLSPLLPTSVVCFSLSPCNFVPYLLFPLCISLPSVSSLHFPSYHYFFLSLLLFKPLLPLTSVSLSFSLSLSLSLSLYSSILWGFSFFAFWRPIFVPLTFSL
jgi:hypothetical protein